MTTFSCQYYLIFLAIFEILHFFTFAGAQEIEAKLRITEKEPSVVVVTGRFAKEQRSLLFVRSYAGFNGLGE
jgi:hypothetical protein